jgi:hypothetical protein
LDKDLRNATPNHGNIKLEFSSDIDKALYIVAKTGSKRDSNYMDFLKEQFGYLQSENIIEQNITMDDKQIREIRGNKIKEIINNTVNKGETTIKNSYINILKGKK